MGRSDPWYHSGCDPILLRIIYNCPFLQIEFFQNQKGCSKSNSKPNYLYQSPKLHYLCQNDCRYYKSSGNRTILHLRKRKKNLNSNYTRFLKQCSWNKSYKVSIYLCVYVCRYTGRLIDKNRLYICMHVYIYICVYVCVCVCVYISQMALPN